MRCFEDNAPPGAHPVGDRVPRRVSGLRCVAGLAALLAFGLQAPLRGAPADAPIAAEARRDGRFETAAEQLRQVNLRALRLAIEDLTVTFADRYPQGGERLRQLEEYERRARELEAGLARREETVPGQVREFALEVERFRARSLLANPLLDFDRLLVLKREFPDPKAARRAMGQELGVGSLNAHTSEDTPREKQWNDELAILADLRGEAKFTTLYRPEHQETLIDPVLHFDGDRLLFAQQGGREKNWRLFEIGTNGAGLRQATPDDGADVGHFDPCYLPDGGIIFASTAVYQGLPCEFGAQQMVCLYRLEARTGKVRQLTFEQDSDWCPTMLHDGSVLYQRWEYTDQAHANSRILFHMNPDGTSQREYRGSGSWFPASFFYAKAIPGHPQQVIGVAGGHHGTPRSGRLLIFDPSAGRRDGEGIVQEIPGYGKKVEPIVRDRLVDGVWPQFLMPFPLSTRYYLVAAKLRPDSLWGIYLVDIFDNMTLVKEVEGAALLWPIAMRRVETPPLIPDRVNPTDPEATVFLTDIYSGPGLEGVPRGAVKNLRLIEYYFSRRGFGGLYGTLGIDGPWDVKRILGTVPVEADGSAHFKIPANTPLAVQPLDARGQALQLMRSWFVGMPGETVACSGCHEPQTQASPNQRAAAARRAASAIEPWHGPARGFSFVREVQPVLDKYCVSCHGEAGKDPPNFTGGRMLTDWSSQLAGRWDGGGKFTEAYYQLQRFVRRPGIEGDRRMLTPMDYHFSATELGQMLDKGHHGVAPDTEAWERLTTWADFNAPYYGTWGEIPQFCGQTEGGQRLARAHRRAMELRREYVPAGPHPDYEVIPETPGLDPTPRIPTEPARPVEGNLECAGWPFDAAVAVERQREAAPGGATTQSLDLGEGVKLELARIPGGRYAMGSSDGPIDEAPRSIVDVKPFWMARFETDNRQFKRFRPGHQSRVADRQGYQFGILGYDQDQPEQPVVRVSWEEAMAFCRWLAERTGHKVTLPTEAQWEWACRAGSGTPFWFGDLDSDYSACANFADRKLKELAADTSLDNYAAARPMPNPNRYDDWVPRDDRFDDGGLVTERVGKYKPNPWGLHDMHGNAWEWTRSIYRPYPYREEDGRNPAAISGGARVARGGSWYDRPKRCTSSYRLAYREYQRVFNVGFRVILED